MMHCIDFKHFKLLSIIAIVLEHRNKNCLKSTLKENCRVTNIKIQEKKVLLYRVNKKKIP